MNPSLQEIGSLHEVNWKRRFASIREVGQKTACAMFFLGAFLCFFNTPIGTAARAEEPRWAEDTAHDQHCKGTTRAWHVRCEFLDGGWSQACSAPNFRRFKNLPVDSNHRLDDSAWWEIRTKDSTCGWTEALSWADDRASDKECKGNAHVWHTRCEDTNDRSWTTCPDRNSTTFKNKTVFSQARLKDKAWTAVSTLQEGECNWTPIPTNEYPMFVKAIFAIDLAYAIRIDRYKDEMLTQSDTRDPERGIIQYYASTRYSGPGEFRFSRQGFKKTNADGSREDLDVGDILDSGLELHLTIFRRHSRHQMNFAILSDRDTLFVSFWGTVLNENLAANYRFVPVKSSNYGGAWVHPGYAGVADDIWERVKQEIISQGGGNKRVIMTGHSMGGGIAGHLMYRALKDGVLEPSKQHRLITFGTPHYGTTSLRTNFNSVIASSAPNTAIYSIEIDEDGQPKSVGASFDDGEIGTTIKLPLDSVLTTYNDDHSHDSYYAVVGKLK